VLVEEARARELWVDRRLDVAQAAAGDQVGVGAADLAAAGEDRVQVERLA
jgi:hypothetical protein